MGSQVPSDEKSTTPLLEEDKAYFLGQKQPEDKDGVVGVPACVTGQPVAYSPETGKLNPDAASLQSSLDLPAAEWRTGLCGCINVSGDESMPRDCEICFLGWFAPCVLYGAINQQLYGDSSSFGPQCFRYFSLCAVGKIICRVNVLAPLLSFPKRTEIRKKFGIKGHMTQLSQQTGCCSNSPHMEKCDAVCDCLLHYLCHRCALCQEARELDRQLPKGQARFAVPTTAPSAQAMAK